MHIQILKEKPSIGCLYYVEKLLETEDISLKTIIELLSVHKINETIRKECNQLQIEHKKTVNSLNIALAEMKDIKEKHALHYKKINESNCYIEKKEKSFTLEKAQLEYEIEILKAELQKKTQEKKPMEEEKQQVKLNDYEQLYKEYKRKYDKKHILFIKLQHTLGINKDQTKLLQDIVDSYQDSKSALENQIEVLKEVNSSIKQKYSTLYERILMQQEELSLQFMLQNEINNLKRDKGIVQAKLNQLEVGIMSGNIHTNDSEEFVPTTDPVFQQVRNPDKYKSRNIRRDSKFQGNDPNLLNLNALKPCKPTFASLLKIPLGHIQYVPPSKDWLFLTARAILDSKYHEHILCNQNNTIPTTFPEFVYDWLGTFFVDNTSRTIKQLEWWSKGNADNLRIQLLAGLSLSRSKKIWELNNFREFLMEDLDLDELGFFLHCRFLLFNGPQLSHSAGRFLAMHNITLKKANELIKTIMQGLSQEGMEQLLELIAKKSMKKTDYIESSFVLRILLEYYHREKKLKFFAIQELFYKCSNSEFTYQSFKDICLSLDASLSPYTIAKSYRDAFMEGNGYISPEVFFIVANNSLFFQMLRLKNPWKIPKLNEEGDIDASSSEYCHYMAKSDNLYKKNKKDIEITTKFIEGMGIPDFQRNLHKLEGVLNRKYQVLDDFKTWNLADVFKQYWFNQNICIFIITILLPACYFVCLLF